MRRLWTVASLALVISMLAVAPAAAAPGSGEPPAKPDSTGTPAEQARAKAILRSSPAFQELQRTQLRSARTPFDFRDAAVLVEGDDAVVGVGSLSDVRSVVITAVVDLDARSVRFLQDVTFGPAGEGRADVRVNNDGIEAFHGWIEGDVLTGAPGYEDIAAGVCEDGAAGDGVVTIQSTCEWAVGAICGTGGGVSCYLACGALGLATGPGGLGCAAACGLIGSLGCVGATNAICG